MSPHPSLVGEIVACCTLLAFLLLPLVVVNWHKVRDCWADITKEIG